MLVTKWKIYSRKTISKIAGFIVIILCIMLGVSAGLDIYLNVENYEAITQKYYMKSNALSSELRYAANRLEYLLRVYKSKDYIKNGGTVNKLKIEDSWQLTNLYNNYLAEYGLENSQETEDLFWKEKSSEIEKVKETIIKSDLANYEQIINELNEPEGLIYYATDGYNECTNTGNTQKSFYDIRNSFITIDERGVVIEPNNGENIYSASLGNRFKAIEEGSDDTIIYVGLTDEGLLLRVEKWNLDRANLIKNSVLIFIYILFLLTAFVYLIIVVGKKFGSEEVHLIFLDKIFTDFNIVFMTMLVALGIKLFNDILNIRYTNIILMKAVMIFTANLLTSLFLVFFLSLIRHIKNGTIIKHSALYESLSRLIKIIIKLFSSGPLMIKLIGAVTFLTVSVYIFSKTYPIFILAELVLAIYIVYIKVNKFKTVYEGIKAVKEGNFNHQISVEGSGEFRLLADNVNSITDGLKIAVQDAVKSEKLKTELITNVSHDIKTPLTSIISYVDLLKREGIQSPNAPKYLDVLDRKSNRLKILTEDLFEAAKATSGSIKANFGRVNVNALTSQLLGELDEKVQESKLQFKVSSEKDRIYAYADGRLLSRVMENLLSNIFKYALKGSRVYIDIFDSENYVHICFKNVSAHELNIPVDELLMRFKRGDESRSSEGNGLGLAIAKSLIEIQKGILDLSIDGDLFKAELKLMKVQSP